MSKPHPLATEIKQWADDPDEWQWQFMKRAYGAECWENCAFETALEASRVYSDQNVRLIPKRNLIPADLLPEGWEVEREDWGYTVRRQPNDPVTDTVAFPSALGELLRHIDKENNNE